MVEEDPAHPRYIQTVWGLGYVFVRTVLRHEACVFAAKLICPHPVDRLLFVSLVTTYLVLNFAILPSLQQFNKVLIRSPYADDR